MARSSLSFPGLCKSVFFLMLAGCAAINENPSLPSSLQTLEYYPHLVKGYQRTYPARRIAVLMTADAHSTGAHSTNAANDQGHDSESNNNTTTPIGLVADQSDSSVESLFASPLGPILQKAISESADEAGMVPLPHESVSYAPEQKIDTDYVLESRVTRAWVKKQRGPDGRFGPTWQTIADFALEVKIYKPPFRVPFWQGVTEESYSDPPKSKLLTPQDQTGIYDEPGQVLSIALTRAVASIFNRDDLRTLIAQDRARR